MKTLCEMYKIWSPSGAEDKLIAFVTDKLSQPVEVDKLGNIYRKYFVPDAPLVCVHLDQVQQHPCHKVEIAKGGIITGRRFNDQPSGLGADDKNGVWLVLRLLEAFPSLNFILTVQEESGGHGLYAIECDWLFEENIPFVLTFDRRGATDLVGKGNMLNSGDLDKAVQEVTDGYFKPAQGLWSDADTLSKVFGLPTVNLSVGYFKPHTSLEFTDFNVLEKNYLYIEQILSELWHEKFEKGGFYGRGFHFLDEDSVSRTSDELFIEGSEDYLRWHEYHFGWKD